jgi:hypothetical protein
MNKMIFIAIGSIIGAAIGGGVAYVYLNKKYDVVFEKETESYRNEIEELKKINYGFQKNEANKLYTKKEEFFKDQKVVDVDPDSLVKDEEDEDFDSEPTKKSGDIRFISKKDFDDDDDFEKEYFDYYMGNATIVQNDEELSVEEFEEVCGNTVLPLLKKDRSLARWSSAGDNEIYIRNERYCVDYKITRLHEVYPAS